MGLPITLASVGVDANDEKAIREIAEQASLPNETSHNGPMRVDADVLVHEIRAADHLGSLFQQGKMT